MLKNPLQVRLEKLEPWQQITFMACLCERMYPNYAMFCENTEFAEPRAYRAILDSVWEILTVKNAKVNFERQLEKLEELFQVPTSMIFTVYTQRWMRVRHCLLYCMVCWIATTFSIQCLK